VWFDARLHAGALDARQLEDLAFFGIAGALVPGDDAVGPSSGEALRRDWGALAAAARRLRRGGFSAYAALGIAPGRIPARGLEALLAELPSWLGRPEVAALAVGLEAGGEREERVVVRQLDLARELRRPVVARPPPRGREAGTRRVLAVLEAAEPDPARVLVGPVDARNVKLVRAFGYAAGLWLSGAQALEEAVGVVASLGPEGIVLGSDAGLGGGDPLALARVADRLARAGLTDAVIRRVCGENAVTLLGVDLRLRPGDGRRRPARARR